MALIELLNGPNLNLLGSRETQWYGNVTLKEIIDTMQLSIQDTPHQLNHFQTNAEFKLIERLHQFIDNPVDIIIINPGAWAHTSIALSDAILAIKIPYIEVHMSNIYARESFRQHSYLSQHAMGVISGLGAQSYYAALNAALSYLTPLN